MLLSQCFNICRANKKIKLTFIHIESTHTELLTCVFLAQLLASELLLGLAVQRGSLRHLLEWIQMALESGGNIGTMQFFSILAQMRTVTASQTGLQQVLPSNMNPTMPLFKAAIMLTDEVCMILNCKQMKLNCLHTV